MSSLLTSTFVTSEVGAAADSGHGECIPDHALGIPSLLHLAAQTRWIRHHHRPAACAVAASVGTRRVSALHCSIAGSQCTQATLRVHLRCKSQHQQHADAHCYKFLAALHAFRKLVVKTYTTSRLTSWAGRETPVDLDEGDWNEDRTWPRLIL